MLVDDILLKLFYQTLELNIDEYQHHRATTSNDYKKDNFYIISIEIVFLYLSEDFTSQNLFIFIVLSIMIQAVSAF
ncbi:hypothetical protein BUZ06_06430 [Staphylococcus gallinarum]|nr:hypothetical protein BUZ05_12305 [Staphylococcus gallinarum]RIO88937.1 hypothetical protein BUZ06_06430 [Staphylococcus gallinarum]